MLVKEMEKKKHKCICYSVIRVMIVRKTTATSHANASPQEYKAVEASCI
jgi:hypothetical protein